MYPKKFWNEFRLPKWANEIFVGMWFEDNNVLKRYDGIIKKAIEQTPLKPRFLKNVITGDSIPIDIMTGIIECKLVLFDISPIEKTIRNSNVMYELGLAHSWRNKEEVIIIRDDNDKLPFDIQSMGVIKYDPNSTSQAIDEIKNTILFRLQEIDKFQNSMVRKSRERLSIEAYNILVNSKGLIFHDRDMPEHIRLLAIPLLLDLGLVEMLTDTSGYGYHPTELGRQVINSYGKPLEEDNLESTYKTLYKKDY